MNKLLIFAGTTEGRELAEYMERQGVTCDVCVATEYGESLLNPETTRHHVHAGRLTEEEMQELMRREKITHVVDATHPYAQIVSENIHEACRLAGCRYMRLLREASLQEKDDAEIVMVDSVDEAVEYLKGTTGGILAATGSKELHKYAAIPNYQERLYARVLSTAESVKIASDLGVEGKHLICMQGPFSLEMNVATLHQTGAKFLVTKESGKTGGFPEKLAAAREAGARLVLIGRPESPAAPEETFDAKQIRAELVKELGIKASRQISLIGIGMGDPMGMTREAWQACEHADLVAGAGRMLETVAELGKPQLAEYMPEKISAYLEEHPEYECIAVLMSGDVGFYSGAKKMREVFAGAEIRQMCGISSVVYLCGKLGTSWEDVKLVSIHGRRQNIAAAVRTNAKTFALVGKEESFHDLCRQLVEFGLENVEIAVGSDLSYPAEKIQRGTPQELAEAKVGDLCAVVIFNQQPEGVVTHGIEDERFLRAKVPMTKSEVRSISLSKLELTRDSVIYDIGAGTGSVSIEMALQASDGFVYAIEKKAEAADLIRQNAAHFHVTNLEVVEALAPEGLENLPVPTHAFIGGSSGNLIEIVELLLKKNPSIRIVINCIALETVAESLNVLKDLPVKDTDIASVSIAKSKKVASYNMMMGQNPVYVISCTGDAERQA